MLFDELFEQNLTPAEYFLKKKEFAEAAKEIPKNREIRIAVMCDSPANELVSLIEIYCSSLGINTEIYLPDYGGFISDVLYGNEALKTFAPEIIYWNVSSKTLPNYQRELGLADLNPEKFAEAMALLWTKAFEIGCQQVIQDNFEPPVDGLHNTENAQPIGQMFNAICQINMQLEIAADRLGFVALLNRSLLSSTVGLHCWFNQSAWYRARQPIGLESQISLAKAFVKEVGFNNGLSKKCVVVDLDNTLWGGIIGDCGQDGIELGPESHAGQVYLDIQSYLKGLKDRGILLAICSKNEYENAILGLQHSNSILKKDDFSAIYSNWEPKSQNIRKIANDLNIGLESIVFLDDNAAEREEVKLGCAGLVAVPNIGSDPIHFLEIFSEQQYFANFPETSEDKIRSESASMISKLEQAQDINEFLSNLGMIARFSEMSSATELRVFQLVNKTNQFNFTGRRYSKSEIDLFGSNPDAYVFCAELKDKHVNHGLTSVILAKRVGENLEIDNWVMSCRVFKRGLERYMFSKLLEFSASIGCTKVIGSYVRTPKNRYIANLYQELGFIEINSAEKNGRLFEFQLDGAADVQEFYINE